MSFKKNVLFYLKRISTSFKKPETNGFLENTEKIFI
uniref:Uncharacterized protein n=1 Tax=viral metagenome TaxID=1070528 RepID=A0A6C0AD42_9ZZZZ